jgi:hypothetical protein
MSLVAYTAAEGGWKLVQSPCGLSLAGRMPFVVLPPGARGAVNGLEIVGGIQAVVPGDLVCMEGPNGLFLEYAVGALPGAAAPRELREGSVCLLTGVPIRVGVLCPGCGGTFAADAFALGNGRCPSCGLAAGDGKEGELPECPP